MIKTANQTPSEEFMFNRHPFTAASIEAQSATPLRRAALVCLSALALTVALAGCAQPWQQYTQGADASTIIARLGAPRESYDLPNGGKRLMWPTQPIFPLDTYSSLAEV